jgi:hypothetical protein
MKLQLMFAALLSAMLLASAAFAQQQGGDETPEPSTDEKLLDSLGGDLLEGLDDIPSEPGDEADAADQPLLDQLEGEDIGEEGENDLSRISRQMRVVEQRIAQQEVSEKTQGLQEQIVADLEALIKKIQQNQKKQSSSSPKNSKPKNNEIKQPDKQPSDGQRTESTKPATDSEDQLTERRTAAADAAAMEALVKRVWGHLPDRVREEMQNATEEEFLPKYQEVIEDYFRRLAEEE